MCPCKSISNSAQKIDFQKAYFGTLKKLLGAKTKPLLQQFPKTDSQNNSVILVYISLISGIKFHTWVKKQSICKERHWKDTFLPRAPSTSRGQWYWQNRWRRPRLNFGGHVGLLEGHGRTPHVCWWPGAAPAAGINAGARTEGRMKGANEGATCGDCGWFWGGGGTKSGIGTAECWWKFGSDVSRFWDDQKIGSCFWELLEA